MLWSPFLAIVFCALEFLAGALIGVSVSLLTCWTRGRVMRTALGAGSAFLFAAAVSNWAGAHQDVLNGIPRDVGPAGEDFWLRNRIAEHGIALCVLSSVAAALLTGRIGGYFDSRKR